MKIKTKNDMIYENIIVFVGVILMGVFVASGILLSIFPIKHKIQLSDIAGVILALGFLAFTIYTSIIITKN